MGQQTKTLTLGEQITGVTGDLANLIAIANACDKEYREGTKNVYGPYVPFDEKSNPELVAQNIAGIQAVMTGVSMMGLVEDREPELEDLRRIANDELDEVEEGLLLRAANCAWGAGQPFRSDKGPLGRANRLNFFDDLKEEEVRKDLYQIRTAARELLTRLS